MARVTLFDQASISPYSRFFGLENQVTVVGHGLQPDDYIPFEAVETNAAPMAKNCGCDFVPAGAISMRSRREPWGGTGKPLSAASNIAPISTASIRLLNS